MIQVSDLSFSVIAPKMKTKFLVYDVETTGLLPRGNKHSMPIEEYPHIIQLSFAIYDYETKRIVWEYDSYVKLDNVDIPEKITNITGITKEICETQGNPMHEVLEKFYEAYMFCEGLVAHNMDFDEKMIKIELERNRPILMKTAPHCFMTFNEMYENVHGIDRYCTMKKGTDLCDLTLEARDGRPAKKKWPKLVQLYEHLFPNQKVNGFHNSLVDVKACLRCYLKMRHNYDDKNII
tara:strand:+ start:1672 stop:2379 length:708 start_codon:yes stop_codon:yes gene_type:complete